MMETQNKTTLPEINEITHSASMGTLSYNCFGYINFHPCLNIILLDSPLSYLTSFLNCFIGCIKHLGRILTILFIDGTSLAVIV